MAEKLLTDRECKNAKPKDGIYYKRDGNGLRLQVRPEGAKYWMLRYTLDQRESTLGLGRYPEVTLDEARSKAAAGRKLIQAGIRPSTDRKVQRARNVQRGEATFRSLADEWLARNKPIWSAHHHERNEGLLRRFLYPKIGVLPIAEINEQMLLQVLKAVYDSGVKESARRARGVAQQVFAYAKETHRASHNPARELAGSSVLKKPEVKHFAALSAKQVGPFLKKLDRSNVQITTRTALYLMLYTGLRDFSLRAAQWNEMDFSAGTWTVPGPRMKSRREHIVPLPRQSVRMLKSLAKITGGQTDAFIFASHGKAGYLAENTLRIAMHRLGFEVTAHGFRSLLTDLLNERGFNADAIERQLDHTNKNTVRAAYLRSQWFDYRRKLLQWVADWADAQRAGKREPAIPTHAVMFRASQNQHITAGKIA